MGVWVRMMEGSFETFQQTYLRILPAGLLALVVFRLLKPREWTIYGVRALVAYTGGVAVFTFAVQHTDLSVVSFLSTLPYSAC